MKTLKLSLMLASILACGNISAGTLDNDGFPIMYIRGSFSNSWDALEEYRMARNGNIYSITLDNLNAQFKISDDDWSINYGTPLNLTDEALRFDNVTAEGQYNGANMNAEVSSPLTISFAYNGEPSTTILFSTKGDIISSDQPEITLHSGTLPVLYINVYDEAGNLQNEIIDYNLNHKNYFSGTYRLDTNGCAWAEEAGFESVGTEEEPLPLEIKARGNWTRIGFSKKPFKLKLGKKQSLLGMSKSKHYAILAHADDNFGYMRNFVGFNLGKRIGLPWTPSQHPIEVYINGDYRGLYFLTESIRVGDDRIMIEELEDNETDKSLVSGGYLVELDNYDEENQIRMEEEGCVEGYRDILRVTFDTPEEYSDIQKRFVTDQFTAINHLVGRNSNELWSYLDLDDAARYYLVEEIISHVEAYHGSTYLFRDRGEGQKWHFSPLWDCGNGFNGPTNDFFYRHSPYGATWIPSFRENEMFNRKVRETWLWFMSNKFDGLYDDIDRYVSAISAAANYDRRRWKDEPVPQDGMPVVDNTDMNRRRNDVVWHLNQKIQWLAGEFGDYTDRVYPESERDTTPAAPLPDYIETSVVKALELFGTEAAYYDLLGNRIATPAAGNIYIVVTTKGTFKAIFR